MIRCDVIIINKLGLHARAAARFVSCASMFSSRVRAGRDGRMVDGKSIMSVMLLAAAQGTTLQLEIEGGDEEAAHAALKALIGNRFDEAE
ncbi:MAG: HPr family phosphocarrier protein [Chromatocurvus sp.]